MESGSVLKGLVYGGFASCVAETGASHRHTHARVKTSRLWKMLRALRAPPRLRSHHARAR